MNKRGSILVAVMCGFAVFALISTALFSAVATRDNAKRSSSAITRIYNQEALSAVALDKALKRLENFRATSSAADIQRIQDASRPIESDAIGNTGMVFSDNLVDMVMFSHFSEACEELLTDAIGNTNGATAEVYMLDNIIGAYADDFDTQMLEQNANIEVTLEDVRFRVKISSNTFTLSKTVAVQGGILRLVKNGDAVETSLDFSNAYAVCTTSDFR